MQSKSTSTIRGHKAMRQKKITRSFGLYLSDTCWKPHTSAATYTVSIKAIVLKAGSRIVSLSYFKK